MRVRSPRILLALLLLAAPALAGDDPKQTPENTISIAVAELPKPQTFPRPLKFYVDNAIDRSGNAQPMLVYKLRGGIFIDKEPAAIVRGALEESLRKAEILAGDKAAADYVLTVYVFHFGLAEGSGFDYYGKVDLAVVVKNAKTGKSEQVPALGTAIQTVGIRKKTVIKNVKENIEVALQDALRNFLRGVKLRDAVVALSEAPVTAQP